jgi:Carboxypeptidase regulatory-like domain/TonB-dependent Receptor Plug Domain
MRKRFHVLRWAIALLAIALAAAPVLAQYGSSTGGIQGRVTDEQGGVLPGVQVTLKGPGAPRTAYTDARGEFRVANLDPGTYTITLTLAGFQTVNRENVTVNLGRNTELTIPMGLTRVEAAVTVSSEAPLLETKKVQTAAIVSQQELKSIPTARDPWVILQSAPGVQIDRMNVAGSESGQQSNFTSHGAGGGTFTVDGVNVTDMSALGSSAAYYDFDMFQEMQVITTGGDASIAGSGAHLNMITKRGTNDLHGSARVFGVDERFESSNLPDEALEQAAPLTSGNHIQSLQDYGAEAGGPIWRDHLWIWGAYGRDQINLITAGGASDKTTLENLNGKLNWQIIPSNAANGWWMHSDKLKFGRGAGISRPQETTWDQTLPQNTWKVEDSQVFSSNLFATVQYNGINGNFTLDPEGGNKQAFIDEGGVWHNSYQIYAAPRPQRQVKGDVSFFFNTGSLGHELKAGFGYLSTGARSHSIWPGDPIPGVNGGLAGGTYGSLFDCTDENDDTLPCAVVTRQSNLVVDNEYWSGFLQDTFSFDRLSINVGIRYDYQTGENKATVVPGNASFPGLLPAIDYPGSGEPFQWEDWEPRIGITYALGSARSTVLKASYSRYAEALGTGLIDNVNPIAGVSYAYYGWNDVNHNNLVEVGEVDTSSLIQSRGYDPANPGAAVSVDSFASGINAPLTDEFLVGIDHELFPAFALGIAYTYRQFNDLITRNLTGLTRGDYEFERNVTGTLPNGTAYSVPTYTIREGIDVPPGYVYDNRSDYDQTYHGVDLILTKRLANRWMARGSFTYNWNEQNAGSGACIDPTNVVPGQGADVGNPQTGYTAQTCADGVVVGVRSTGSGDKSSVFLSSKWQFSMNAMYQLPLGFNIAGSFYGRQGYPVNWWRRITGADGEQRDLAVSDLDDERYADVFELDGRIEKVVPITQSANLTISADVFNITNEDTILQRVNRLNRGPGLASGNTNDIKEIQAPRVWRFGLRLAF